MLTLLICVVLGAVGGVGVLHALRWGSHHLAACIAAVFGVLIALAFLYGPVERRLNPKPDPMALPPPPSR
jgi:hypothetical protein